MGIVWWLSSTGLMAAPEGSFEVRDQTFLGDWWFPFHQAFDSPR